MRVTATGSVSLFLAAHAKHLAELAAAEGVAVSVLTTRATLDVVGGEAEVALRMRRLPKDGPLTGRRLGRVAFAVYAARALAWAGDDWRGLDVVGLPETARVRSQSRWLEDTAERCGAVVRLRFGEVALRHRAVREGAGASLLPCFLGDADPALVRLLDPPPELVEDVHLLLHERDRRTRRVRVVADALCQVSRDEVDALCGVGQEPSSGLRQLAMRAFRHHIPRRSMVGEPLTEPVEIGGRALVTGATGFVGSAVAAALARRGSGARAGAAVQRPAQPGRAAGRGRDRRPARPGVARAGGGRLPLPVPCRRRLPPLGARSRRRSSATNVEGTRGLMEAALAAGVERIVYTSSVATLGSRRRQRRPTRPRRPTRTT